jgi:hypothetical protein
MTNTERREIIMSFQSNPQVHPLTCGNNSSHSLLFPVDVAGELFLYCPDCDYKQWIDDGFFTLLNKLDKQTRESLTMKTQLPRYITIIEQLVGIIEKADREGWDIPYDDLQKVGRAKIYLGNSTIRDK